MSFDFPCTRCGICCKHIANIPELKCYDRGDGVCIHLDMASNLCKIYDNRPEVCSIALMQKRYANQYSKEEFIRLNIRSCNKLQEIFSIDEKYRINIER